jgi:hypothetical protein
VTVLPIRAALIPVAATALFVLIVLLMASD